MSVILQLKPSSGYASKITRPDECRTESEIDIPCWRPQAKPGIPGFVPGGDHTSVACRNNLSRMKRKTRHIPVRLSNLLPYTIPKYFAAGCARRILNQRNRVLLGDGSEPGKITWHAHLMDAKDCSCRIGNGGFNLVDINVECLRANIDEHRRGAAIPDAVGGGDEGMTDRDYFIAWSTPAASRARCKAAVQLDTAQA